MKKALILIALSLVVGLVGCSGGDSSSSNPNDPALAPKDMNQDMSNKPKIAGSGAGDAGAKEGGGQGQATAKPGL
ncbi:MAG: hypothetical protein JST40_10850 [Armatimonadetes bacterium]|nr:hypothetical protein [Armatimonadota bacterium]